MFTTGHAPLPSADPVSLTFREERRQQHDNDASAAMTDEDTNTSKMVATSTSTTTTPMTTTMDDKKDVMDDEKDVVGWMEKNTLAAAKHHVLSTQTQYPPFVVHMTNNVTLDGGVVLPLKQRSIHWNHPDMSRQGDKSLYLSLQPSTMKLAQEQGREEVEAMLMQLNLLPMPMPISPVILTLTRGEWDAWIDSFGQFKLLLYLKIAATKMATDLHSAEALKKKLAFYELMTISVQNRVFELFTSWIEHVLADDLDITSDEVCAEFLQLQREMTYRLTHTLEYQLLDLYELPRTGKDGGRHFLTPTGLPLDKSVIDEQEMPARRYHEMIRNIMVCYTLKWQFYCEDARRHYPADAKVEKWPERFFNFTPFVNDHGWVPSAPILHGWMHKEVLAKIMQFYINVYRNEKKFRDAGDSSSNDERME